MRVMGVKLMITEIKTCDELKPDHVWYCTVVFSEEYINNNTDTATDQAHFAYRCYHATQPRLVVAWRSGSVVGLDQRS